MELVSIVRFDSNPKLSDGFSLWVKQRWNNRIVSWVPQPRRTYAFVWYVVFIFLRPYRLRIQTGPNYKDPVNGLGNAQAEKLPRHPGADVLGHQGTYTWTQKPVHRACDGEVGKWEGCDVIVISKSVINHS